MDTTEDSAYVRIISTEAGSEDCDPPAEESETTREEIGCLVTVATKEVPTKIDILVHIMH